MSGWLWVPLVVTGWIFVAVGVVLLLAMGAGMERARQIADGDHARFMRQQSVMDEADRTEDM